MDTLNNICEMVLANLDTKFAHTVYQLWFEDMKLAELSENHAVFSINSDFKCKTLDKHYKTAVKGALSEVMGFEVEVEFTSSEGEDGVSSVLETIRAKDEQEKLNMAAEKERMEQELLSKMESPSIVEDYTFGNFIVGESNKFAYAACYAIATLSESVDYNPLFLYGPSGLGKTHLLFAITNNLKMQKPDIRIVYKKGEEFINEMVNALKEGTMNYFRERYRFADVLLIDDIQFIAGKVSIQEEFFHTFSALFESGKKIIMTSDRPPKEIHPLEERLRTRFEWGLLADIQPPSEELRTAIIKQKAEQLNIFIPEDAIEFLSNSLHKNIRQIEGAIKKISAISSITSTPVSLEMCRRSIADIVSGIEPSPVTVDRILNIVAKNYGVTVDDLKGTRRNANIATARHMGIYLTRKCTELSVTEIGKIFNRDHATVISSIKKVEDEKRYDPFLHTLIGELTKKIKEENP